MVTVGIDSSLCATGLAVCGSKDDGGELVKTKKDGDTPLNEIKRLMDIVLKVELYCMTHHPKLVVMEALAMSSRNSSALTQLSGLNYMIRERLYRSGFKFVVVAPSSLKKFATGKGNCPKDNIMLEVYKRWGVSFTDNNVCDAYALAKVGQALMGKMEDMTIPQQEVVNLLKKQL